MFENDDCSGKVSTVEQSPKREESACVNLKGTGTVLSMKNTSRKSVLWWGGGGGRG